MRFVPLALLLSLSPSPLLAHDGHGAAALGVTVEELVNETQQWNGALAGVSPGAASGESAAHWHPGRCGAAMAHPPGHQRSGDRARHQALNLKDGTTRVFQPGRPLLR